MGGVAGDGESDGDVWESGDGDGDGEIRSDEDVEVERSEEPLGLRWGDV